MKIDSYTKVILTIIAACLIWTCARDFPLTRSVEAQTGRVTIVGTDYPIPIVIQGIKRGKNSIGEAQPWETLPVSK